ncbi:lipocalin-like domain-containing protein [Pandoraea sp.]|uniref:lipocalin-like domain-containing protein n=1 Tax=Pandoraea sp. TaxID=1883445 RepID=UPI001215870E|nr:lipocalin-like domain-containing protein [Pandoraea sp.]TAL52856.1 MAG: lipocalin-like domain-containing protein [Pandoraea sp.]TAM19699.1 MAG: lipocalin-like domain-containing protein [Pandoraea sp.]
MKNLDVKGRWQILAWEQIFDDGRITYPMGRELDGFMAYGPSGMFCAIARKERPDFTTGGQWNASDAEKAEAYNTYLTYAGDWDVEGNVVTHKVKLCLFPNWVGSEQKRYAELDGDQLTLTTHKLEAGTSEARVARLTFKRA